MTAVVVRQPLYARLLRLRHLRLSSLWCFLCGEGMAALGVLLALAELVSWWAVLALPAAVAGMVKLNDLVAGAVRRAGDDRTDPPAEPALAGGSSAPGAVPPARMGSARVWASVPREVVERGGGRLWPEPACGDDPVGSPHQRQRQSARRRYGG